VWSQVNDQLANAKKTNDYKYGPINIYFYFYIIP
jgi:hypothetical protein